jgi:hypothetical protein
LVAKLGHQEGVRATLTALNNGKIIFGVELLKDIYYSLMLRECSKVALFVADDIENDLLYGVLVDRQMTGSNPLTQVELVEIG